MIKLKDILNEQGPKKFLEPLDINPGHVLDLYKKAFGQIPTVAGSTGNFKDLGYDYFDTMNGPLLTVGTDGDKGAYSRALSGFKFSPDFTVASKEFLGKPPYRGKLLTLTWISITSKGGGKFNVNYNAKNYGDFDTLSFYNWLKKMKLISSMSLMNLR